MGRSPTIDVPSYSKQVVNSPVSGSELNKQNPTDWAFGNDIGHRALAALGIVMTLKVDTQENCPTMQAAASINAGMIYGSSRSRDRSGGCAYNERWFVLIQMMDRQSEIGSSGEEPWFARARSLWGDAMPPEASRRLA